MDGNSIGRNPTITPVDEGLHDVSYVPPPVGMHTLTESKIDRSKSGKIDIYTEINKTLNFVFG